MTNAVYALPTLPSCLVAPQSGALTVEGQEYVLDIPAGQSLVIRCGTTSLRISAEGITLLSPRIDLNN